MDKMSQEMFAELMPLLIPRAPCEDYIEVTKNYILKGLTPDEVFDVTEKLSAELDFTDPETKKYIDAEFNAFIAAATHYNCGPHWRLFSKTSVHWQPLPASGCRNRHAE
jgi:hypothetical protein